MNPIPKKLSDTQMWLIIAVMPLVGFAVDIYTPSLPVITGFFHVSNALGKLTIAIFIFGFGLGQIFIGPLSDRYGRKVVLCSSLFVFALASLGATFSKSIDFLFIMRLIQGLGASGLALNIRAVAADAFSGKDLQRVSTYIAMVWAISPVIGPVIGGYLQTFINWYAGFYFLTIYAVICGILIFIFIPETSAYREPFHIKQLSANYYKIAKSWSYMQNVLGLGLAFSIINVFNVLAPFIIQIDFKRTPLFYAHVALVVGIVSFLGGFMNRLLMKHLSLKNIISLCIIVMMLTSIISIITSIFIGLTLVTVVVPTGIMLFFAMMIYPNLSANCSSQFKQIAGTAAAYQGVISMLIASIAMALMSSLHVTSIFPYLGCYVILAFLMVIVLSNPYVFIQANQKHRTEF